jgi:hypothetical protein
MLLPYQPSILDRIFRYCPVHLIHYRPPVLVDSMVDGNIRRLFAGYPINLRAGETRLAAIQPSEYHHHPVTCRLTVVALSGDTPGALSHARGYPYAKCDILVCGMHLQVTTKLE